MEHMKCEEIKKTVLADIRSGRLGEIGGKFLTLRQFCARYGVSYRTAVKLYAQLKTERILTVRDKAHYLSDCETGTEHADRPLLGLHVRDISNAFYSALCSALIAAADAYGYDLVVMSSENDMLRKKRILRKFIELKCVGVLNLNSFHEEQLCDFYKLYPLPFVMYGAKPLKDIRADFILTDNELSGGQAAKHLKEIGAQAYFYVTLENVDEEMDERLKGLRQYLPQTTVQVLKMPADFNDADRCEYLGGILFRASRKSKIGIFCHHDLLAVTVLKLLEKKGVSVPEDAAVIGYDNLPISEYTAPDLTTFAYSYRGIAEKCLQLLEKRIRDPRRPQSVTEIPTALIIRNSTKKRTPGSAPA